jgi:hypothetical protein
MSTSTATGTETFTDTDFDAVASAYGADSEGAKFKRLVDAIASIGVDQREDHLTRVDELIGRLENMSANGSGHTPPSGKGFGSDNAAVIADKILGKAQTVGATRTAFSNWGKNTR